MGAKSAVKSCPWRKGDTHTPR